MYGGARKRMENIIIAIFYCYIRHTEPDESNKDLHLNKSINKKRILWYEGMNLCLYRRVGTSKTVLLLLVGGKFNQFNVECCMLHVMVNINIIQIFIYYLLFWRIFRSPTLIMSPRELWPSMCRLRYHRKKSTIIKNWTKKIQFIFIIVAYFGLFALIMW